MFGRPEDLSACVDALGNLGLYGVGLYFRQCF